MEVPRESENIMAVWIHFLFHPTLSTRLTHKQEVRERESEIEGEEKRARENFNCFIRNSFFFFLALLPQSLFRRVENGY